MDEEVKAPNEFEAIKQEMIDKITSQESKLSDLSNNLNQVLESLKAAQKKEEPKQEGASDSLSDLLYSDPEKAVAIMRNQIKAEINQELSAQQINQNRQAQVLNQLSSEFPQLRDTNSALSKKAVEIYNTFDDSFKNSPAAYEAAVYKAATLTKTLPSSVKGADNSDSFSMSGSSIAGNREKSEERSTKDDEKMLRFAAQMGLDINNKEVVKRLKERSKRNFLNYE